MSGKSRRWQSGNDRRSAGDFTRTADGTPQWHSFLTGGVKGGGTEGWSDRNLCPSWRYWEGWKGRETAAVGGAEGEAGSGGALGLYDSKERRVL